MNCRAQPKTARYVGQPCFRQVFVETKERRMRLESGQACYPSQWREIAL